MPAAIEHRDLNTAVYDALRGELLAGRLSAGEKLSLNVLAEQLGVSRSPVHQALTRLAAEGLVTVRTRRGYEVTPVTGREVVEEYDVRLGLELIAAERAIGNLDERRLEAFDAAVRETLRLGRDGKAMDVGPYVRANQKLHRLQMELAENAALLKVYGSLRVSLLMERLLGGVAIDAATAKTLGEQHQALFDAFAAADLGAARTVIREHLEIGKALAVEAIERAGGWR